MTGPWADWDHVLKLDPDKELVDGERYEDVVRTGTDAIEIGGTLDVTADKTRAIIDACRKYDVPLYQEPSDPTVVVDDDALSGYLVPLVLNAGHPFWLAGAHKEWVRMDDVDWDRTTMEAYIVMNPEAAVAKLTEANCDLDADDVAAYATVAERMFGQEIVYVEYSGTFGDPDIVAAASDGLDEATLFYGGGVHDYDSAKTMGELADVVVVGDLVHDVGCEAVRATVEGARDA